ncbi:F-box protein, partial [Trifolium medium]|nr:F-box protein [Trifolium medium]
IELLPDAVLQFILSHINNGRDVAYCNCVSKRWKNSMAYIKSLYFTRNAFDNPSHNENADIIVKRMVHLSLISSFEWTTLVTIRLDMKARQNWTVLVQQ